MVECNLLQVFIACPLSAKKRVAQSCSRLVAAKVSKITLSTWGELK